MSLGTDVRRHHEEWVCDEPAKRRWGVALYRVETFYDVERAELEQRGLVAVEDEIDNLCTLYAHRRTAPIAKSAVAVEGSWFRAVHWLWVHGWVEAPPISSFRHRHWWQYVSPFPWHGGKRRRDA